MAHEHHLHHRAPVASSSRLVPRADPAPSPTPSSSSSFSGQSYALGMLSGFGICAALLGGFLYLRARRRARQRRLRSTLAPDKYVYVVPGARQGHHIITEPTLGDDEQEAGMGSIRRPGSPTGTVMTGTGTEWGVASTVHGHPASVQDLMAPSTPTSPYTPSLPVAMRDERGRFHAPSEPGSPLAIPDRAFSQSALVRTSSYASGSSGNSRPSTLLSPLSSRLSHVPFAASAATIPVTPPRTSKERREQEAAIKARLGLGMRLRSRSVDTGDATASGVAASAAAHGGDGDGVLPPYSREEDPDPFKR